MQRLNNALRVDAARTTLAQNSSRADRIGTMRTRALLAALSNHRADLLAQLLSHLGDKTFAQTLATLSAREQVAALHMLSTERRASVFRELTQPQRDIWHQAVQTEQQAKPSMLVRCKQLLRAPFAKANPTKAA
ncbi:hypothetical protein G7048_07955 [Diaphorobacter sp. HDW4B]|uniref:hypothetical protein n=1 Tax=Diaphorobacter sp. HDW4B TaxID=2714925 RepID=UPI00140D385B|nr:hypothetical protein [Diaphorobacter sp. HDW4B]QIL70292.1 hypothetical protein G7048_07955 [Diaphorobacter sp. HDW4B]